MTVLGSNFIHHKRWIPFFPPVIHLFLLVHGNSTLSSLSLPTIYLRICQTSGCLLSNVKSPIVSNTFRIIERERERDCSTCPGGESVPAGTANFLEFSKGSISISSNLDYRWRCRNSHTFDANVNLSSLDSRALREEIVFY